KSLEATDKGIRLIEVVHPEVKSPAMTGQWEAYLHRIQRGKAQLEPFMKGIEEYVREVVGKVGEVRPPPRNGGAAVGAAQPEEVERQPLPHGRGSDLGSTGSDGRSRSSDGPHDEGPSPRAMGSL